MSPICNIMTVPCNQLVHLVIEDEATNASDAATLRTVSIEHHRILQITPTFSNQHKMGVEKNTLLSQICNLMIGPCNQFAGMVIGVDAANNYDASTL
jgi:hypothetical protein